MDRPIITQPPPPLYTEPAPQGIPRPLQDPSPAPRDIAYLEGQEELRVYQELDEWDAAFLKTTFDRFNTYVICNSDDRAAYFATESSDTAWRICLQQRPMKVDVKDNYGSVVMRLDRPWRCKASWLCCCHLQEMFIERPTGVVLASISESWTCWRPDFDVSTTDGGGFLVRGAWTACRCSGNIKFYVYDRLEQKVAVIYKATDNFTERCAYLNDFRVKYLATTLTAQEKLIILGAAFLVDFNYLELRV